MLEIVGFEGHSSDTDEVVFGAAVCRDASVATLRVSGTETFFKVAQWEGLVAKGSVTLVTPPMPVHDSVLRYSARIMRLRRGTQVYKIVGPRTNVSGSGVMVRHEPPESEFSYYLFVSPTAVERFGRGIAARLVSDACGVDEEAARDMQRIARIFDPKVK